MFTTITLLAYVTFTTCILFMLNLITDSKLSLKECVAYGTALGLLLSTPALLP